MNHRPTEELFSEISTRARGRGTEEYYTYTLGISKALRHKDRMIVGNVLEWVDSQTVSDSEGVSLGKSRINRGNLPDVRMNAYMRTRK